MQWGFPTFLLLLTSTTAGYLLPSPPGKYNVSVTSGPLIDYKRSDPYAATPMPRALVLSVFQPTTCASTVAVPYMPDKTANYQGPYLQQAFNIPANLSPLFQEAHLPVCSDHHGSCSPPKDGPILFLSPGLGIPRLYYNVLASAIASEGFTVITIDHPEDANIITYPDGRAVYLNNSVWEDVPKAQSVRADDASFLIDQLSNATAIAELLPQRGPRPFRTDRIGMLGHSLGGGAAVFAASQDPRIRGAINWDGTIWGSLPSAGLTQPVLLMSRINESDLDWAKLWPQFKGPKLIVTVEKTTHQSFSDVLSLLQASGQDMTPFADLLGTIAPTHLVHILATYTAAWMNAVFTGDFQGSLLQGQDKDKFPEVLTVMKDNF